MSLFKKDYQYTLKIDGMKCEHCEKHLEESIKKIDGVKKVKANHVTGLVLVKSNKEITEDQFKNKVDEVEKILVSVSKN